jgi:3-hydroxyisobutyrate dehydrogenase-like beta-hydroxyacid dehydrogenase
MTRIGFVGAGQLGGPMVARLVAAGHDVTVHARRVEVRMELAAAGARAVDTLEAACADAEVFLVCLFSDAQLAEVGPAAVAALPSGAVLASHVTGSVQLVRDLAQQGAARGVEVVDAPVSGTADDIRAGRLTVLLGGGPAAVGRCTDAVGAYAAEILPTGALGSALEVKLVNNLLFAANCQLAAAAWQLGESLGIEPHALFACLGRSSGNSTAASHLGRFPDLASFGAQVAPFLVKDVAVAAAEAAALGADPVLLLDVVRRGPLAITGPAAAG